MNVLSTLEEAACEAARLAGAVLRKRFRTADASRLETKGLHDYVTAVDREAEAVILEFLQSRYPDHAVMSEESRPDTPRERYRWVVDPLDGTTNFAHGVSPFAVSIGVEDDEGLAAAAVYDPLHEEMFQAHRGGGARLDGEVIRCSRPPDPDKALIATGFPFRELSRLDNYLEAFAAVVRSTAGLRRAGSASIDLAYTACGRYDGFFEIGLCRWDLAAGALLVQEAGGRVTDVSGGATFAESGDIVAAGPEIHAMLLGITRAAFG
jgi:myo-inositol-1(or 4)-monophosphatase